MTFSFKQEVAPSGSKVSYDPWAEVGSGSHQ